METPDGTVIERAAVAIEARVPLVIAAWLHGSWGTEDERADSDVDVAVLARDPLSPQAVLALAADLSGIFRRDADLLDMRRTSTVARAHVVWKGRLIVSKDDKARQLFEIFAFSSYTKLNEERAGILADIAARGSIHAR